MLRPIVVAGDLHVLVSISPALASIILVLLFLVNFGSFVLAKISEANLYYIISVKFQFAPKLAKVH